MKTNAHVYIVKRFPAGAAEFDHFAAGENVEKTLHCVRELNACLSELEIRRALTDLELGSCLEVSAEEGARILILCVGIERGGMREILGVHYRRTSLVASRLC